MLVLRISHMTTKVTKVKRRETSHFKKHENNFIVLEMWKHHMSCKSINMKVVVTLQSSGKTMQNQAGSITKVLETSCPKFLLSQCHGGPIGCNSLQNPQSQCRAHHQNIIHQLLTFQFSRWFFFRKQKSTWSPHPLAPCTP